MFYVTADPNGNINGRYDTNFASYTIPTGAVEITETQWNDSMQNPSKYIVQNGSLVLAPAPTAAERLASAQRAKIVELNAACQQTIYAGFDCDPDGSGTTYHFPFDQEAQNNYSEYLIDILSGSTASEDWKVKYPDGTWNTLTVTAANFQTNVRPKAKSFKQAQIDEFRALDGQVMSATTVSAVDGISWSPATY